MKVKDFREMLQKTESFLSNTPHCESECKNINIILKELESVPDSNFIAPASTLSLLLIKCRMDGQFSILNKS